MSKVKESKLEIVVARIRGRLVDLIDRDMALKVLKDAIDEHGMYDIAKCFGVLEGGSAEEFAIEFMSAYNAEVSPGTY